MKVQMREQFGVEFNSEGEGFGDVLRVVARYLDSNPDLEVVDLRPHRGGRQGTGLDLTVQRTEEHQGREE